MSRKMLLVLIVLIVGGTLPGPPVWSHYVSDGQSTRAQDAAPGTDEDQHPDLRVQKAEVPMYPPVARAGRVSGVVEARVTVRDGSVIDVKVKSGPTILAQAAAENIKTWRFPQWVNTSFDTK